MLHGIDGFVRLICFVEGVGEVGVGFFVCGIESDGLYECGDGGFEFTGRFETLDAAHLRHDG